MHVSELGARPRNIELVSVVDGGTYTFQDDGHNYQGAPNARRQNLIDVLSKQNKDGHPLFVLASARPPMPDGDQSDPLRFAKVMDDAARAIVNAALIKRGSVALEASVKIEVEQHKANAKKSSAQ